MSEEIKTNKDKLEQVLVTAMQQVLYDYAWYKDGEMLVGCGVRTYKDAKETLPERAKTLIEDSLRFKEL